MPGPRCGKQSGEALGAVIEKRLRTGLGSVSEGLSAQE